MKLKTKYHLPTIIALQNFLGNNPQKQFNSMGWNIKSIEL